MKRKLIYLIVLFAFLALSFIAFWKRLHPEMKESTQAEPTLFLKQKSFAELPGWEKAKLKKSLLAFQLSCKIFIHQDPEQRVGSESIDLKVKDWLPACHQALSIHPVTEKLAREFFQQSFKVVELQNKEPILGLFTGYYMASLRGSKTKTKTFDVPIYGLPSNLVTINLGLFDPLFKNRRITGRIEGHEILPYPTRAEINQGAIKNKAPILLWVNSHIDRLFLEIQGSGTVELTDGSRIYLGYAGQNGAPYTAIAKVLIDKGVMSRENASMQAIRYYLDEHPTEIDEILNQNRSFVFFRKLKENVALGAQGASLTPGYSLAIDRKWIPMGAPLWLVTTRPDTQDPTQTKTLQRLMIAQDTGGAIRGPVRGDVYWGAGDFATYVAGHMKSQGHYWLLLPSHQVTWLEKKIT